MAEAVACSPTQRYALVTGANKGIGFEVCRQLASEGITVILTSRNEERGVEALERLKEVSGKVAYHQLDVVDPASVAAAAEFIRTRYGRLDILVNNAGSGGIGVEGDIMIIQEVIEADVDSAFTGKPEQVELKAKAKFIQTYEGAKECVQTNYYGAKRITEALIPLLQLSASPRIVNVSSLLGNLTLMPNEWAKGVLSREDGLTEEAIDEVVRVFLEHFEVGSLKDNRWPTHVTAYKVSKAALTAYTRCLAKKHPRFCINSLCPGFTRTDITCNLGPLSVEEAAESVVALALLPDGGPSGLFFYRKDVFSF